MTNEELIKELQKYPLDMRILLNMHWSWDGLTFDFKVIQKDYLIELNAGNK